MNETHHENVEAAGTSSEQSTSGLNTQPEIPFLSDDELANQGLVKITAFMRTEQSIEAARKKRQREKEANQGVKQLNVKLPVEAHETVKAIAQACAQGKTVQEAIQSVTSPPNSHPQTATRKWKAVLLRFFRHVCTLLER